MINALKKYLSFEKGRKVFRQYLQDELQYNDGIKQGIERGIEQEQKQIILNMYEAGCDAETISGLTKISMETVKSVLKDI
ncbi:MAG: hypothetical protein K1W06_04275 [Lachnospiraceae bacterium]